MQHDGSDGEGTPRRSDRREFDGTARERRRRERARRRRARQERDPAAPRGDGGSERRGGGWWPADVRDRWRRWRKRRRRDREEHDPLETAGEAYEAVESVRGCAGPTRGWLRRRRRDDCDGDACGGCGGDGGGRGDGCDGCGCSGPCDLPLLQLSTLLVLAAAVVPHRGADVLVRALVRGYQRWLSRFTPRCPQTPSCSAYALAAIESRGARRGLAAAAARVRGCGRPGAGVHRSP